jgi:hypothetical protein
MISYGTGTNGKVTLDRYGGQICLGGQMEPINYIQAQNLVHALEEAIADAKREG